MTHRSVAHATFTVERTYDASQARVFAAWADPAAKAHWFASPEDWGPDEFELDFRVDGRELNRGGPKGGPVYTYDARYQDIVPDERIVYTYSMHLDQTLLSISVATVEFRAEAPAPGWSSPSRAPTSTQGLGGPAHARSGRAAGRARRRATARARR